MPQANALIGKMGKTQMIFFCKPLVVSGRHNSSSVLLQKLFNYLIFFQLPCTCYKNDFHLLFCLFVDNSFINDIGSFWIKKICYMLCLCPGKQSVTFLCKYYFPHTYKFTFIFGIKLWFPLRVSFRIIWKYVYSF